MCFIVSFANFLCISVCFYDIFIFCFLYFDQFQTIVWPYVFLYVFMTYLSLFLDTWINFRLLSDYSEHQSVLIERVATQEVSAVWSIAIDLHVKLAQKSSSSSSISINNGGYYDINNDPLLGTHILRIGMQEVRKIST